MAQFDQASIVSRITNNLRSKESWAQFLSTSTAQDLINAFAEEEARFALFSEYLLRESKWDLAQNLSSLNTQGSINGYDASRKVGALGFLDVSAVETFDAPPAVDIDIPKGTIFSNGEYDYTSLDSYVLSTIDDFIQVLVIQGTPTTTTFNAIGDNFEEFQIDEDSIENSYASLRVNGVEWSEIDDIREAEDGNDQVYEIQNISDFSGIIIRFGNNILGRKLEAGDFVEFEYYITEGSQGNIIGTDAVTEISSTIFDTNGDVVDIFVTNNESISGGSDLEELESIRSKAPQIGQSGNSATTKASYKALIETIPFVSTATVWGAIETNLDNDDPYSTYIPTEDNLVKISAFTDSGEQLSSSQKEFIIDSLLDRKAPTDIIQFFDTDFVKLKFNVSAFGNDRSIPLSQLRSSIISNISEQYSLFNFQFKQDLYESDYKAFINGITGVGHHNTSIELIKDNVSFESAYTSEINLDIFTVKTSSVKVFVKDLTEATPVWVGVALDDGSGNFTAGSFDESGNFTPGGTNVLGVTNVTGSNINYTTGKGTLVIVDGLSEDVGDYLIRYDYQLDSLDIVPLKRQQILRYEESIVTIAYQETI